MTKRPAFEKVQTEFGEVYAVNACNDDEVVCEDCCCIVKETEAFYREDEEGKHMLCADCSEVQ